MAAPQTHKNGEWVLLEAHVPGRPPEPIGILLRDARNNRLHIRLKNRWWDMLPEEEDREIWRELEDDLKQRARESGAAEFLDWLENTASHSLQVSPRQTIPILKVEAILNSLFDQHVLMSQASLRTVQIPERSRRPGRRNVPRARLWVLRYADKFCPFFSASIVLASVAAILMLGAFLSFKPLHSTRTGIVKPDVNALQTKTDEPVLPIVYSPMGDEFYFLNIDLKSQSAFGPRHAQTSQHWRGRLKAEHLVIRPVKLRAPQLPAQPPSIEIAANSTVPLSSSLPEPPRFKSRGNRFIHALALIAIPFRAAGLR